jgi:hypothetical protein
MTHHPAWRAVSCCYQSATVKLNRVDGPSIAIEGGRRTIDRLRGGRPAVAGVARQGVARQGVARQGVARQGVARQGVARQGVARQGVARQGVGRPRDMGRRVGGHGAGSK